MMRRIMPLLALLSALCLLAGCGGEIAVRTEEPPEKAPANHAETTEAPRNLVYAPGTVLRMATGYDSAQTGLTFDAETAGDGITLADGVTYHAGDLKPTWAEAQRRLGIRFDDRYLGNTAEKEFRSWRDRMEEIDLVSGGAADLTAYGELGELVDLSRYLDIMPNFRTYLNENPVVRLSITGNTDIGSIYFAPYFDGVDDIERMPLMRVDWVEKLLDGRGAFSAPKSGMIREMYYQPYMPTFGKVAVDVVKKDGSDVETIYKDYNAAGNIIARMNAAGQMPGELAVNMLRAYIDEAYGGYYGTKRSDLFVGRNAAWDADELVALLRCVVANP